MNILIVAYDARSTALAASYRVRKFIKYLLLAGDKVTLITSSFDDPEKELNGCEVHCVSDNVKYVTFQKYIKRIFGMPDPSVFWAVKAYRFFSKLNLDKNEIDSIIISSPPHGIQKFALLAAEQYRAKIICDLRDDFLTNDRMRWLTPIHKYYGKKLETDFVKKSTFIILNTDVVFDKISSRHQKYKDKMSVITNGYDGNLTTDINGLERMGIVYVGSDYNGYAVDVIAQIAAQLVLAGPPKDLKIVTAGPGDWSIAANFDFWNHHGLVNQAASNMLVDNAGVLLLLMPPGEREPSGTVPLKAYQYLASNNPIFYFGERGATSDLLSEFELTYCFHRTEISNFVKHYKVFEAQRVHRVKRDFYQKYSFKVLTEKLRKKMIL